MLYERTGPLDTLAPSKAGYVYEPDPVEWEANVRLECDALNAKAQLGRT